MCQDATTVFVVKERSVGVLTHVICCQWVLLFRIMFFLPDQVCYFSVETIKHEVRHQHLPCLHL